MGGSRVSGDYLFSMQALREGPLPAVPAAGTTSQRVCAGDEGPTAPAAVGGVQGEGAVRPAGPSAGSPVHLSPPRGVRCPLPGGTHDQHLPGHAGKSEGCLPLVLWGRT